MAETTSQREARMDKLYNAVLKQMKKDGLVCNRGHLHATASDVAETSVFVLMDHPDAFRADVDESSAGDA